MPEHYTAKTESVTVYCGRCGRVTLHLVSGGRMGRCEECVRPVRVKLPKSQQLHLFEPKP